jgi:diphthine-ammonia ligase
MVKSSFCSWSGGKDSCMALYKAMNRGYNVEYLLTMMSDKVNTSRSHGISSGLLFEQADRLKIKMIQKRASWEDYESVFISAVNELRRKKIIHGIFGDIDTQAHLDWVAKISQTTHIRYFEPLWQSKREVVIKEFIDAGFKAIIVSCDSKKMDKKYLGREITYDLIDELLPTGIDAAGENGEYHTFVYDGPIFDGRINFSKKEIVINGGYLFLKLE